MGTEQFAAYKFDKEMFEFADQSNIERDKRIETKPIGYLGDAFRRFCKNKGSIVAAIIIAILVLYAIIGPLCFNKGYQDSYGKNNDLLRYKQLLPRNKLFEGTGFWDGTKEVEVSRYSYDTYRAQEIETGLAAIQKDYGAIIRTDEFGSTSLKFKVRLNTYYSNAPFSVTLTPEKYEALQKWQDERGIQVILPYVDSTLSPQSSTNPRIWYVTNEKGIAVYKEGTVDSTGIGELVPAYVTTGEDGYTSRMRIAGDPGLTGDMEHAYRYAKVTGSSGADNYVLRVSAYNYFIYMYDFEPYFIFGSDPSGYDIFSRLASGARFSLILAVCISVINLFIGAIYGSIEGYYGGTTDIIMERISDILANVPFTVVAVLFKLHLAKEVGLVGSLIFAFILTGWIGMASSTRMQFYRFKNQEYVLAARTLGAKDRRIMFKHIFPNSLGTLITGCVLVIPGVIFSETSLTYLGIMNLDSASRASIGAMLSNGQNVMVDTPHAVFFPALFIALLEISFNLFGNGLRDAFNPSLRGSEE